MSPTKLKLASLMALMVVSLNVTAGPCKPGERSKRCQQKEVKLTPAPAPEPALEKAKSEPSPVLTQVVVLPDPPVVATKIMPPSQFLLGMSAPTLVRVPGIPTQVVVACDKVIATNGTFSHTYLSQTTAMQSFGQINR
jgi:hypothetical protein